MGKKKKKKALVVTDADHSISSHLETMHPIAGMVGRVFVRTGGEDRFALWADENYGGFIRMMTSMVPSQTPMSNVQGDVNLIVHQALAPTSLDQAKDVTPDE